jgi:hypothetical protein
LDEIANSSAKQPGNGHVLPVGHFFQSEELNGSEYHYNFHDLGSVTILRRSFLLSHVSAHPLALGAEYCWKTLREFAFLDRGVFASIRLGVSRYSDKEDTWLSISRANRSFNNAGSAGLRR